MRKIVKLSEDFAGAVIFCGRGITSSGPLTPEFAVLLFRLEISDVCQRQSRGGRIWAF